MIGLNYIDECFTNPVAVEDWYVAVEFKAVSDEN
jgi:hypothetical protein